MSDEELKALITEAREWQDFEKSMASAALIQRLADALAELAKQREPVPQWRSDSKVLRKIVRGFFERWRADVSTDRMEEEVKRVQQEILDPLPAAPGSEHDPVAPASTTIRANYVMGGKVERPDESEADAKIVQQVVPDFSVVMLKSGVVALDVYINQLRDRLAVYESGGFKDADALAAKFIDLTGQLAERNLQHDTLLANYKELEIRADELEAQVKYFKQFDYAGSYVAEMEEDVKRLEAQLATSEVQIAWRDAALEQAKEAIRDIDAHATPIGLADPNDPDGNPVYYAVTVGALHRALGKSGTSPKCHAEETVATLTAQVAERTAQRDEADEATVRWADENAELERWLAERDARIAELERELAGTVLL